MSQLTDTRANLVGHCRFFQNEQVSLSALQEEATCRCAEHAQGGDLLVIGDSSELNYQHHVGKLSKDDVDLGPVGNNRDIGFFLHPMLTVDARDGFPLGFADIYTWNRSWGKQDKHARAYQTLPIEAKESYRWIACGQRTKALLAHSARLTIVYDREADMYDEYRPLDARDYRRRSPGRRRSRCRYGQHGVPHGRADEILRGLDCGERVDISRHS